MSVALGNGVHVSENASLAARNTLRVPARARLLVEARDISALPGLLDMGLLRQPDLLVLGGGSNVLFAADPPGPVLAIGARGMRIDASAGDEDTAIVEADAGADWHDLVCWSLGHSLCGLENLALIPGTVGAAPIQNIGAYGVEVGERVESVLAFDRVARALVRLEPGQLAFAYRDSVFKHDPARFVIASVRLRLSRRFVPQLAYAGIGAELDAMGVAGAPRASQVAEAVMRIRRRKLPDPDVIGNAGSFFKNPMVSAGDAQALLAAHPDMPVFRGDRADTRKLSAAWLIDRCGWKGHRDGDAGVSPDHALVLVNHGGATGEQLLDLARRIAASVVERFGVAIEPEPRIVGASW